MPKFLGVRMNVVQDLFATFQLDHLKYVLINFLLFHRKFRLKSIELLHRMIHSPVIKLNAVGDSNLFAMSLLLIVPVTIFLWQPC